MGKIVFYRVTWDDIPELKHNSAVILPAIVTGIWEDDQGRVRANLRVFPDGPSPSIWREGVLKGRIGGQWSEKYE